MFWMLLKNTFWALTVAFIWQANVQNICQQAEVFDVL